jgi:hypothetical protein
MSTGNNHERAAELHDMAAHAHRSAAFGHNDIAALAYALWEARGYPGGSPEEDWFHAVQQLPARTLRA